MTFTFTIRPLESHADYLRAEDAQRAIWQIYDDTAVVPLHVLITAQKNGGLVAGAFDQDERMIAFLYGFLGFTKTGKVKHCSHLMGVLPELRRTGVGEAMKRFQAKYVRDQGVGLITWTYDPLEGVNAKLNIAKLRTVARSYQPNLYGTMLDNLNKGIPTDRFEVEWWLNHPHVLEPALTPPDPYALQANRGALLVNPAIHDQAPVPLPGIVTPALGLDTGGSADQRIPASGSISTIDIGQLPDTLNIEIAPPGSDTPSIAARDQRDLPNVLLVEVPASYQNVKLHSMDLARAWRMHTRTIFERLFSSGYVVLDFVSKAEQHDGPRRNYYILQKEPPIPDV